MRQRLLICLLAAFMGMASSSGCGTLSNGRGWGQDAGLPAGLERIHRAVHRGMFDLQTLIPAAGALVFAVGDYDERVSDWATEHTPVFGSHENARKGSDYLNNALLAEAFVTAFAAPSGEEPGTWTCSKLKGIGVELAAVGLTHGTTNLLKGAADRERPDHSGKDSFPSGHASVAFSYATLANRNLDAIHVPEKYRVPLQVSNLILATGVAWARVEGRHHYPSDVLAGAALGHFLSAFIHDAFLGVPERDRFGFAIFPLRGGAMARFAFFF